MPETNYTINYDAKADKAVRGIDKLDDRLLKLEKTVDRVDGKLKKFGGDLPEAKKSVAVLSSLEKHLEAIAKDADKAEKELKDVGKDAKAITGFTDRVEKLVVHLNAATAAIVAAVAALHAAQAGGAGRPRAGGGRKAGLPPAGGGGGGEGATGVAGLAGMAKGAGMAMAAYAVYRIGQESIRRGGEATRERRTFFGDATDLASTFRKDLQEGAVLDGKNSVDDAYIRDRLKAQKATGLNAEEYNELHLEFGGAVAAGLTRKDANGVPNITEATAKDLEMEAGKFGARYRLDMKTTGRFAGLLANYQKVPDAATGVGVLAESAQQLNLFGVGPVKGMLAPMTGLMASMVEEEGGRFDTAQSLSARFAATTVSTGGKAFMAANQIRQANRGLRKFGMDNGQGEFLKGVGVTAEDSYEGALAKVAPKIAGPNGDQVLLAAGFNEEERLALIKQAKMIPVVQAQLKDPRMAKARLEAVAGNEEFARSVEGQERAAENQGFAAEIEAGLAGQRFKTARMQARARMVSEGRLKPEAFSQTMFGDMVREMSTLGGVSGEDVRIDTEAIEGLKREGQKVNVDIDKEFPGLSTYNRTTSLQDQGALQNEFGRAAGKIDAAKALAKLGAAANQAQQALNQMGGNGGGGPPPPVGNGGGGVNPGRR